MIDAPKLERRRRFLAPRHAAAQYVSIQWQGEGWAETPAEDAWCRILLRRRDPDTGWLAAFAAFGPPIVIASADWICEQADSMDTLTTTSLIEALALTAGERYASLLVFDALANARKNLGS